LSDDRQLGIKPNPNGAGRPKDPDFEGMSPLEVLWWNVAKLLKNRTIKRPITKNDIIALHALWVITQTMQSDAGLPPFSSLGLVEATIESAAEAPSQPEPKLPADPPTPEKIWKQI